MNERILDLAVALGLWLILALAPLKWGLPLLEPGRMPLPQSGLEWAVGSWPIEAFCLAVYFLFFLQCMAILSRGIFPRMRPALVALGPILFMAMAHLSSRCGFQTATSNSSNLLYAAYVLLFLLLVWRCELHHFLCSALIVSMGVVSLIAVFQRFFGFAQTSQWASIYFAGNSHIAQMQAKLKSGRVFSTLVYPNSLGGYLVMTLPLSMVWWWKGLREVRSRRALVGSMVTIFAVGVLYLLVSLDSPDAWIHGRWYGIFFLGAIAAPCTGLFALFLSRSQGSILVFAGLALFIALYLWLRRRTDHRRGVGLALAGLLSVAGVLLGTDLVARHLKWDTLLMRWSYWVAAFKMGLSRWWLGYGPGSFGAVYPRFKLDWGGQTQLAHSHVLQVFAELGIVGVAGWLWWWMGWIVLPGHREDRSASDDFLRWVRWGATLGLIAFLLHGFLDFDFYVPGIAIQACFLNACVWRDHLVTGTKCMNLSTASRRIPAREEP